MVYDLTHIPILSKVNLIVESSSLDLHDLTDFI